MPWMKKTIVKLDVLVWTNDAWWCWINLNSSVIWKPGRTDYVIGLKMGWYSNPLKKTFCRISILLVFKDFQTFVLVQSPVLIVFKKESYRLIVSPQLMNLLCYCADVRAIPLGTWQPKIQVSSITFNDPGCPLAALSSAGPWAQRGGSRLRQPILGGMVFWATSEAELFPWHFGTISRVHESWCWSWHWPARLGNKSVLLMLHAQQHATHLLL